MPTISWAGFSPTMGASGANIPSTAGTLQDGESHLARKIAALLRKPQFRAQRALLRVLNGNNVGAGGNAVSNRGRVKSKQALANTAAIGGSVEIENNFELGSSTSGRVTATADQTRLNAMIDEIVYPSTYPADASGNGGGGKIFNL